MLLGLRYRAFFHGHNNLLYWSLRLHFKEFENFCQEESFGAGGKVPIPSGNYCTDVVGGGIGSALIMTDGGNAANVGFSRNDDGYSGPINLWFTLNYFGNPFTQFFANYNGNISFGGGVADSRPALLTRQASPP